MCQALCFSIACIKSFNSWQCYEVRTIIVTILQMKKQRPGKIEYDQDQTASEDFNPAIQSLHNTLEVPSSGEWDRRDGWIDDGMD